MKKIQCEMCGGTTIKKIDDMTFECQNCGIQYSKEEAQKLLVEITGEVRIDHKKDVENAITRGEHYESLGDIKTATEYYNKALDMDPENTNAIEKLNRFKEGSWSSKLEREIKTYLENLDKFEASFKEADDYYNEQIDNLLRKRDDIIKSLGLPSKIDLEKIVNDEQMLNATKKYLYETTKLYDEFNENFKMNFVEDSENYQISQTYDKLWYVNLNPNKQDSAAYQYIQNNYLNLCAFLWTVGHDSMGDLWPELDYTEVLPIRYRNNFSDTFKHMCIEESEATKFAWKEKTISDIFEISNIDSNLCYADSLYEKAKQFVVESGQANISFLQRKLKIGYSHAARLIDELQENRIIGPYDGAKPRAVLVSKDQLNTASNIDDKLDMSKVEALFENVDSGMTEQILTLASKYGKDNPYHKMYKKAVVFIAKEQKIEDGVWSLSSKLDISYKNAERLIKMLEEDGLIAYNQELHDYEIFIYPSEFSGAVNLNLNKMSLIGKTKEKEDSYIVNRELLNKLLDLLRDNPLIDLPTLAVKVRKSIKYHDGIRDNFNIFAEWYRRVIIDKEEI